MAINPHPTLENHYIVDCRPGGYKAKRVRLTVEGLETAERTHDLLMRQPAKRQAPPVNSTCAAIFKRWIVSYREEKEESTAADAEASWKHLAPYFGIVLPKNLTEETIEKYKTDKMKTLKKRTINKHLSYFSSMLKWAKKKKLAPALVFQIPFYEKKHVTAKKPRPITQGQITAIYNAIEEQYRLVFLLMADAGLRRQEALRLRREDVEYDSGLIFVTGKGSKERIVPITTDRLREELDKRVDRKGWLTVNPQTEQPYTTIRKALERAAEKAGVDKHVYHHLLRHSFGTNMTAASVDLKALQNIMGHSSPNTTQMYQHLAGDYLREQARKLQKNVHMDTKNGEKEDDSK